MEHPDDQLELALRESDSSTGLGCRGIFSVSYLRQHLAKSEHFPSVQEAEPIYSQIKTRWVQNQTGLRKRKEAYTRTQFLDPSLRELGWFFIPEQNLPAKTITRNRPDYNIEVTASTEMEVVKAKEERWKQARAQLQPFLNVGDIWLAVLDSAPINELDYRTLALGEIAPGALNHDQKTALQEARRNFTDLILQKKNTLIPFHWHLEFPDVFFQGAVR